MLPGREWALRLLVGAQATFSRREFRYFWFCIKEYAYILAIDPFQIGRFSQAVRSQCDSYKLLSVPSPLTGHLIMYTHGMRFKEPVKRRPIYSNGGSSEYPSSYRTPLPTLTTQWPGLFISFNTIIPLLIISIIPFSILHPLG